jgi:hypothetical protein
MKTFVICPQYLNGTIYKNYSEDELVRPSYCYLHGELENLVGYDCFYLYKADLSSQEIDESWLSEKFPEGAHPAEFESQACTFFYWKCRILRPHGLVVLNSDTEAYQDAFNKFTMKSVHI